MHLNIRIPKKVLVLLLVLIVAVLGGVYYSRQTDKNPLPDNIRGVVSYKVIYPSSTKQIDAKSFNYQTDKKTLSFKVNTKTGNVVFTEQAAPDALGSDTQAYYPALGIHPYAQFKISLGQVALTKFWQSGNLKPAGQSAVLASGGTFLIAHSEKNLTNNQWKELFKSAKITK
jgi:uncharacterized protein YxeA